MAQDNRRRLYSPGLVSVVILSWNRETDLKEVIEGLEAQTYSPIEIIVVDNASTDGSLNMVKQSFPNVRLIVNPKNMGVSGWNKGYTVAKGQFVCFLDNDILLPKDWVEKLVLEFKRRPPSVGLLAPCVFDPDGLRWPSKKNFNREFYCGDFQGSGFMALKQALSKTQLYPKDYFLFENEHALSAELLLAGFRILHVPQVQHFHKGRLILNDPRAFYSTRNALFTIWKYYPTRLVLPFTARLVLTRCLVSLYHGKFGQYLKAVIEALHSLPFYLRTRTPVSNPDLFIRR